MDRVIVYGSEYGSARRYAQQLGQLTGIETRSYEKESGIHDCSLGIHVGALYAGGVKGLKNTLKQLPKQSQLVIVTVGIADVNNRENTDFIKKNIKRQLPEEVFERTTIFHLRGAIDYKKLNFIHKRMMSMVYKKNKNMPEEEKTAEIRDMIDTYNKHADFIDYDALNPIVDYIQQC